MTPSSANCKQFQCTVRRRRTVTATRLASCHDKPAERPDIRLECRTGHRPNCPNRPNRKKAVGIPGRIVSLFSPSFPMAYVKPERVAGEDYLFVRRGARGATYQYIRGVPAAVAHLVGRTIWQHSLGSDLPSARRQATAYAAQHDQLAKPDVLKLATIPHGVIDLSETVVMEPVTRHMRLDEHGQWRGHSRCRPSPPLRSQLPKIWRTCSSRTSSRSRSGTPADLDPAEALAAVARYQRALRDWQDQEDMRAEMAPLTAALVASNGTAPPARRLAR